MDLSYQMSGNMYLKGKLEYQRFYCKWQFVVFHTFNAILTLFGLKSLDPIFPCEMLLFDICNLLMLFPRYMLPMIFPCYMLLMLFPCYLLFISSNAIPMLLTITLPLTTTSWYSQCYSPPITFLFNLSPFNLWWQQMYSVIDRS